MSGAVKMHRIEVLKPDGSLKNIYLVTEEKANAVQTLLEQEAQDDDNELIDAMDAFPQLRDPKYRTQVLFRSIRTKNQITQEDLAQKLGITQAEVSKIETGKRAIGKKLAKKIEKVFKIDYRRFL